MSLYSADTYEAAVADALADKDLETAVSLMRDMAVEHPHRAEKLLEAIQQVIDRGGA
jgi:hypothetical protein